MSKRKKKERKEESVERKKEEKITNYEICKEREKV